jgi:RNA polymerase sigma-70 factor (ECF subfamily)
MNADERSERDPDALLMQQACENDDRGAFEQIYCRYYPMVIAFLAQHEADQERLDDLTQEVFRRAWQHRRRCRNYRRASMFLTGIARNVIRENSKRRKRDIVCRRLDDTAPAHKPVTYETPVTVAQRHEAHRDIHQGMRRLPSKQREAVNLADLEQLSRREAARRVGCSLKAFCQRLALGRSRLRVLLKHLNR